MLEQVAVLGVGAMGDPIARRLHECGVTVTVYDRDLGRVGRLVDAGLRPASSASEAATNVQFLILMVANTTQAEEALFGRDGAATGLGDGTNVIVMSTVGPEAVRELAGRLSERGVAVVDAPVSGGVEKARNGTLLVMAAGEDAAYDAAAPLLRLLGDPVARVGQEVGEGQSVKLVNQLLCGIHVAAAAEAISFAEALGLDSAAVWDVVRQGAAASFMLDDRGKRMVKQTFEPVNSAISIFVKDLGLVTCSARAVGHPTSLATTAEQMFLAAAESGLASHDDSELVKSVKTARPDDPPSTPTEEACAS